MIESGVAEAVINNPNYIGAHGYLEDADKFDAGFFAYSAREADIIDPQQRRLGNLKGPDVDMDRDIQELIVEGGQWGIRQYQCGN